MLVHLRFLQDIWRLCMCRGGFTSTCSRVSLPSGFLKLSPAASR
jgi:hypothetical protein